MVISIFAQIFHLKSYRGLHRLQVVPGALIFDSSLAGQGRANQDDVIFTAIEVELVLWEVVFAPAMLIPCAKFQVELHSASLIAGQTLFQHIDIREVLR